MTGSSTISVNRTPGGPSVPRLISCQNALQRKASISEARFTFLMSYVLTIKFLEKVLPLDGT